MLALISVCFDPAFRGQPEKSLIAFDEWDSIWRMQGRDAGRTLDACRMRALSLHGKLARAFEIGAQHEGSHGDGADMESEYLSAPARTYEALLRVQRGEFSAALPFAERSRNLVMLHELSPTISGGLEDFAVFLAHIRSLVNKDDGDTQLEERLLSELGVWLPLPPVEHLTAREREIALFTSLGYSSKLIAERLHLSTRTIETHVAHVYSKLGLTNREQLRHWFGADRTSLRRSDRP